MSVLIEGLELPKEPDTIIEIAIYGDKKAVKTGITCKSSKDGNNYYIPLTSETYSVIEVEESHGELIDRDALLKEACGRLLLCTKYGNEFQKPYEILRAIETAPTVIPTSEIDT